MFFSAYCEWKSNAVLVQSCRHHVYTEPQYRASSVCECDSVVQNLHCTGQNGLNPQGILGGLLPDLDSVYAGGV